MHVLFAGRDCPERKSTNLALIAHDGDSGGGYSDADSEDDNSKHLAFVTTETALFSKHLLHLDSQSSTNVINNKRILVSGTIRKAAKAIVLNGVDKDTPGIAIDRVGDMKDIGEVYYSPKAAANILSFAAMTDAGAEISYDEKHGRFTMRPKGSENIYSFCRQDKPGCEGKFYVCDTRTMIAQKPTSHPQIDRAMVATVSENMQKYSKREVESAGAARELLARMGYPSVDNAIDMIRGSDNIKVTERDFRVAHDIWGKDVTSMRGKTKKKATAIADITVRTPVVQKQQVLSVDIMFVETVPSLVAVATPLDLVLAVSLKLADMDKAQRTASAVKEGLDSMVGTMISQGFSVSMIFSDGEGGIVHADYPGHDSRV
jgi:hypothetical protein